MGASAGGIPPAQRVISALPADFPAAVFVTIHTAADSPGFLSNIFGRTSHLPVAYAVDGESISFRQTAEELHRQAQVIRHLLLERKQPPLTGTDD